MKKIEDIKSPSFLKNLSIKELEQLAAEIRTFIIENVSKTGGHLSANLGVVELTIALHYVFNSPLDKLIFDVGHQSYTHKILTGRANEFHTLRKKDGISGFLKYEESIHDIWEAGHSSTSISAATGFLEAKSMGAEIGEVVTIIGDGSIQNGLALSGLNYLGSKKDQKAIIILNDNEMSISQNVGSLSKIFNRIRIRKSYQLLKKIAPKFIHVMFRDVKSAIKTYVYRNNMISSIGYKYFGPINGHNLKTMIRYFEYAKKCDRSIIIHLKTIKGKGYPYSEQDKIGEWHGIGPFKVESGEQLKTTPEGKISWSDGIGQLLIDAAKKNPNIKVISPAMIYGSGLDRFASELPNQIIDVGIAEEHGVVMASAMSMCGIIPIVSIYSTFLQRAYDQLNHDIARVNAHVVFLIDRAGIVGADGDTHQGTFDISYLSALPNMTIAMPKDLNEANDLLNYALYQHQGPFAIRYPKGLIRHEINEICEIEYGSWDEIIPINKVNIVTYGPVINKFKDIITNEHKDLGLINARFIKPLDLKILKKLENTKVIIYEEVVLNGSLSSLMLQKSNQENLQIDFEIIGIDDKFIEHGSIKELKRDLGLDIREITKKY